MRAIVNSGAGGWEVLALEERPTAEPGDHQIRVRVAAAGLNRADLLQRKGAYPAPPGWPADIPGLEYAGTVDRVGPAVTQWTVGDRVMGLVGGGGHAEAVVVHEAEALPVPPELSWTEAAAIPEAFLTAYDALVTRAEVTAGERVLVHAVGSGVSTAAIQVAKWLGATTVGTGRTAAKLAHAKALGLDEGIDTSVGSFAGVVDPVQVVIDLLGGPAFQRNLEVLGPRGRLVLLGFLQGPVVEKASLELVLRKRLRIVGTVMRTRALDERIPLIQEFRTRAIPAFAGPTPALRPVVGATYPMTKIAEAHRAMEQNEVFGKIVLTW